MADRPVRTGIAAPALRVIGAGLGRTGMLSLREALVRLGLAPATTCGRTSSILNGSHSGMRPCVAKTAGEMIDWRALLDGFQAIVDWPGAYFGELAAAHPEAKVSSVRDPERWYDSMQATIFTCGATNDRRWPGTSSPPAPSTVDSPIARIARPFLPSTIRRCRRQLTPTGCWSLRSSRDGSRCARSWASPFPRMSSSARQ